MYINKMMIITCFSITWLVLEWLPTIPRKQEVRLSTMTTRGKTGFPQVKTRQPQHPPPPHPEIQNYPHQSVVLSAIVCWLGEMQMVRQDLLFPRCHHLKLLKFDTTQLLHVNTIRINKCRLLNLAWLLNGLGWVRFNIIFFLSD